MVVDFSHRCLQRVQEPAAAWAMGCGRSLLMEAKTVLLPPAHPWRGRTTSWGVQPPCTEAGKEKGWMGVAYGQANGHGRTRDAFHIAPRGF